MADITDVISAALIKQDSDSSLISDLWLAADNGLVRTKTVRGKKYILLSKGALREDKIALNRNGVAFSYSPYSFDMRGNYFLATFIPGTLSALALTMLSIATKLALLVVLIPFIPLAGFLYVWNMEPWDRTTLDIALVQNELKKLENEYLPKPERNK